MMELVSWKVSEPSCNGALKVSSEMLKEPGVNTLGLQRKIYVCERCGFSRRKKEPLYPSGKAGLIMRLTGTRRNVKIE
jgi:C4-type Zn-finger protein